MARTYWDPQAFDRGENMHIPADPEGRRDVAIVLLQDGEVALAHEIAYRAIDRFHDKTFDNIVSGEKNRDFVFERGSVSAFIASAQLLIEDRARAGAPLSHLQEVYLRLNSDRSEVYRHGPPAARPWIDSALCCLIVQRHLVGLVSADEAREAIQYLARSSGGEPIRVPERILRYLPCVELEPTKDTDFDALVFAPSMRVEMPQADTKSTREEFQAELTRMASENLQYFRGHQLVMHALERDIAAGARFVNVFQVPKEKPILVVTNVAVWLVTPKMFSGAATVRIGYSELENLEVRRRPFKHCLSAELVASSRAETIEFQFAFVCHHGYEDPVSQERLRIAIHNAEVAETEIRTYWRRG